ncbi:MAG: YggT family protein [Emcibacteraceae bacterium]|nr:YggT family protein [Emcibacteraceae bacterium]
MGLSSIISFLLLIYIVIGLLISFNVINSYNQFVNAVYGSLYKLFEPILSPIRNALPDLGGIDFSPIVVFFALRFLTPFIAEIFIQLA